MYFLLGRSLGILRGKKRALYDTINNTPKTSSCWFPVVNPLVLHDGRHNNYPMLFSCFLRWLTGSVLRLYLQDLRLGLPLAAGLGAPWGLWLPPSFCGMAMASSSILVAPCRFRMGKKAMQDLGRAPWRLLLLDIYI